jgi:hypothetical protein
MTAFGAAQSYPRLHVTALSQRADRATVAPNGVFVVTIHVRITQQRERLDELILGTFDNCEIISTETIRTTLPGSTDFTERLTVQALAAGEATISPAYIDALDPTIGKPMRFSSNAVRVAVTGAAPLDLGLRTFAQTARRLLLAVLIVIGCAAAVFVLGVIFVRGRKRRPATVPVPAPATVGGVYEPAPVIAPDDRLARAAQSYRVTRAPAELVELRAVLFELAGTRRGATLVDALHALAERDPALRTALLAAERALFGSLGERPAASDELLTAVQACDTRGPANQDAWTR